MAMRMIRKEATADFNPKQGFDVEIPAVLLQDEDDRQCQRLLALWENFKSAAVSICQARCNRRISQRYRRVIFKPMMDNLCRDFTRRTENLKVDFQVVPRRGTFTLGSSRKEDCRLKFLLLNDIPDSCRNAPWCVAEIPPREVQAFGTHVSDRYDTGLRFVLEQWSAAGAVEIPMASVELLDHLDGSERSIYVEGDDDVNPPLAMAVLVAATLEPFPVLATARLELAS